MLGEVPRALVMRTTVVYGPDRQEKNFVYQLIRACREGRASASPPTRGRARPTTRTWPRPASSCASATRRGLYHLAGDGVLDRYAFALLACEVFGLDPSDSRRDHGLARPEGAASARRRASIAKAQALLQTPLRSPAAGLRAMREAIEEGQRRGDPACCRRLRRRRRCRRPRGEAGR